MRWRLRYQLLVPLIVLLLGVAAVSAWAALSAAERARRDVEGRMRQVATTLSEPPRFNLSPTVLEKMKLLSGADYLLVRAGGQRQTTLSADPSAIDLPPASAVHDDWQTLRLGPRLIVDDRAYLSSGVRLHTPGEEVTLYILYPESAWRDALWEAVRPSLVLGGFLGLAAVGLAAAVGRRLTRRVRDLERRTRQIAAGDFSPMPLPAPNDELRDLARSVNEMAQRLAQLQEAIQRTERLRLLGQVSGGLAHQLRNGVTGARLAVQLHLRELEVTQPDDGPPPDPAALEVALRQLTLVESNLKRFLDLGNTDRGAVLPCSVVALLDEAVSLLTPQCRHAGIDLRWHPPAEGLTIPGDPGQLQQLFVNVLGNAVEAAGPGGWVEVKCGVRNAECEVKKDSAPRIPHSAFIEVTDSGPGPAAAVADRLFEPFVTGKPEGVGLGLAVARQVAEAHGGRVTWSRDSGHTCFRIELEGRGKVEAGEPLAALQPPGGHESR